jgi:hypothetical protein
VNGRAQLRLAIGDESGSDEWEAGHVDPAGLWPDSAQFADLVRGG